jgi:hypothetical protein
MDHEPTDRTLIEVLGELSDEGFTQDMFVTTGSMVRCGTCHADTPPTELELDRLVRIEGASDPADMAAVLGLTCRHCGARGTAVVRFGPEADRQDDEVLAALDDHRF